MEYLSDAMLLGVVVLNIAIIIASCVVNTGTAKHPKKKNMMATVIMLSVNLILDVAFMAYFAMSNMAENGKVFILFLPLIGWLLYEDIKEFRAVRKSL